jgi:hypothetical protein
MTLITLWLAFLQITYGLYCVANPGKTGSYGWMNWDLMLSNRGAIGGAFTGATLVVTYLFALLGQLAAYITHDRRRQVRPPGMNEAWRPRQRHFKRIAVANHCGRGCSRLCAGCAEANDDDRSVDDDDDHGAVPPGSHDLANINYGGMDPKKDPAKGKDDTGIGNMFTATDPGDVVTWGALGDAAGVILSVALPLVLGDLLVDPRQKFAAVAVQLVFQIAALLADPFYLYGETIDKPIVDSASLKAGQVDQPRRRYQNKMAMMIPPHVFVILFEIWMAAWYFTMATWNYFGRIRYGLDAEEKVAMAHANAFLLVSMATFGVLAGFIVFGVCYAIYR